jgi:hypothetical protein
MSEDERSAVLIIRAWREERDADSLRARITGTADADAPGREETVAAGEAEILAAVRAWLNDFAKT